MANEEIFKKIIAHCKEYGFIFPSSEIYDGLGAVYDYGQNGTELKNNIKQYWWKAMVQMNENIVGIDAAIDNITQGRGIEYDSDVVDACVRLFDENRFEFSVEI